MPSIDPIVEAQELMPFAAETLAGINDRGYEIGMISNQAWARFAEKTLSRLQIDEFSKVKIFSSNVGYIKPHPKISETALDALGIGAGDAIFVGDIYEVDYLGARSVGMRAVLLSEKNHPEAETINSLRELLTIV